MELLVFLALALAATGNSALAQDTECSPNFEFADVPVSDRASAAQYVFLGRVTRIVASLADPSLYGARISVSHVFKGVFANEVEYPVEVFVSGFGDAANCRSSVGVRETNLFFVVRDDAGGLAAFYTPTDGSFGPAVAPSRLDSLQLTENAINELHSACANSEDGCCADGTTPMGECRAPADNLDKPDPAIFDVKEPTAEKTTIDVVDALKLYLLDSVSFSEDHFCPVRSQVDYNIEPEAPVSRPMAQIFADYPSTAFPANFSFIFLSKQSPTEESTLFSIYQNSDSRFGVGFINNRFFVDFSGDETVNFENAGLADGSFHRYAVGVAGKVVSFYADCELVATATSAAQGPTETKSGTFIVGNEEPEANGYTGTLESIIFTNDPTDAANLCEIIPDCPPPPPTDPPPTTASPTTEKPSTMAPPKVTSPPVVITVPVTRAPVDPGSVECNATRGCPFYGVCNLVLGRCECAPCSGSEEFDVVCVRGVTYDNECEAQRSMCVNQFFDDIVPGSCDDETTPTTSGAEPTGSGTSPTGSGILPMCASMICPFSGICQESPEGPVCTCDFSCPTSGTAAVCGNDGVTYESECALNKTRCMKMENILVMSKGKCGDMPIKPCQGNEPLSKPANCTSDSNCPPNSYCHIGMTFSACCPSSSTASPPTPTPIPDCLESTFGCCPDRATPAQNSNKTGCPSKINLLDELDIAQDEGSGSEEVDSYCVELGPAYKITHHNDFSLMLTEVFSQFFPRDFSVHAILRTTQSGTSNLLTIYSATSAIQFALTIEGNKLIIDYARDQSGGRGQLEFDVTLNDGAYHRLAVSIRESSVTVFIDCVAVDSQIMSRDPAAYFDVMGNLFVGKRLLGQKPFDVDFQHLFINPDPAAAAKYCAGIDALCSTPSTAPPMTTAVPTTTPPLLTTTPPARTTMPPDPTTEEPTTEEPTTEKPTTEEPTPTQKTSPVAPPAIPQFSGENSFVEMDSFPRQAEFFLTMQFRAGSGDGTLLYVGNPDNGGFILITVTNRYVHFNFNSGSGDVALSTDNTVTPGQWHTIQISLVKLKATLQLDDGDEVKGSRTKKSDRFDFGENSLYYGGVPDSLTPVSDIVTGFDGCIGEVKLNQAESPVDFTMAKGMKNVVACKNDANPLTPSPTPSPVDATEGPFFPKFSGSNSYVATDPSSIRTSKFTISIDINAGDGEGTVFYVGNSKVGDFISITLKNRDAFFRVSAGTGVVSLQAKGKVGKNKPHTLTASVGGTDATFQLDKRDKVTGTREDSSDKFQFKSVLVYYGGFPDDLELMDAAEAVSGFTGCINSVTLNDDLVDFASAERTNVANCEA